MDTKTRKPPPDISMENITMDKLTNDLAIVWLKIQDESQRLCNPFFSTGYYKLISDCGQDVRVVVIKNNGEVVGFFPYEMETINIARPVGSIFSDYQGVIAYPSASWNPMDLLRAANIRSWRFDHLVEWQQEFAPFVQKTDVSWLIDIRNGFCFYTEVLRRKKCSQLVEARRKARLIEREVGALKFHPHVADHDLLNLLLNWKSEQWAKSGWCGRFKSKWEQQLMHSLLEIKEENFQGVFSVLEAGGRPVAMHLGMRSKTVWHLWTTGYDPEYKRYSPGILKHIEMVKSANSLGIQFMDMGKEDFEYKRRLHTHTVDLCEGMIEV